MSSTAISAFNPLALTNSRDWSNDRYCTEHCSFSIPSFTKLPFWYNKCCITLNLPLSFLVTTPYGDMTFYEGFFKRSRVPVYSYLKYSLKGPIILPNCTFFIFFSLAIFELS
ncbi:hypothetical protein XELAEV_18035346mg [Xenopus laevis]|uniref:Uncharacterized protein n=1 Tax=Xenopus laevis TaxID=8355 RepID=A0A974CFI6_XENLA|nr:hypothetical protein XELAEV_18035346mg [Xenopus laevis]